MSGFNTIKKSRKRSHEIEEKLNVLNRELEKTKDIQEQPTMHTSGIFVKSEDQANQDHSDFESKSFGGEGLGFSGADGNTAGNASIGDYLGVSGVALSPPHPVTGVRINAVHVRDGLGGTTPLRPGVTIGRGFSDNPPQYTMGSCLWFFDSDFDNGAGQPAGKWCNLEFSNFDGDSNGKWFFWDTVKTGQFAGIYIVNTDLSQHPCGDISDLISGLNFPGDGGAIGSAFNTVMTQQSLDEPDNILIDIKDLAVQAFNYLKDKAQDVGKDLKNIWNDLKDAGADFAKDIEEFMDERGDDLADLGKAAEVYGDYFSGNLKDGDIDNDYLGQDYVDDAFTNASINDNGTVSVGDNVIGSGGKPEYDPETGIVKIPFEYDFDTNEEQIMKDPNKYDPSNSILTAVGMVSAWILGGKYGLDSTPVPFAGYATWFAKNVGFGGKPTTGHGITMPIDEVKEKNFPLYSHIIQNKIGVSESYVPERIKLGQFEPKVLDVDIKQLRKNIKPEFPKDPPPEMIDGYSAKSRLAPKKIEREPFIKITKKDLAQNHNLTDKDISDFMNDVKMINDYIKKNPADLIYAQQRYPKHDPRLAQLNWQMDQMLDASKKYVDRQFPENKNLFNKIKNKIKKTIDQTDPKNFKPVKDPIKYVDVNKKKKLKETVTRHFNKPVKSKSMFGLNMGKVRKTNQKMIEKREQEQRVKEEERVYIQEKMSRQKSNWKDDLTTL